VNGINLRVDPADISDREIGSAMSRRLTRELERVLPGDQVDLRVYSAGESRTVRVRTADSESLYGKVRVAHNDLDERPSLGVGVAATQTRRDTLGVLVMFVDDSGPAARAGIEEGNRIAAINGVDLRVNREDTDDDNAAIAKVRRLQREVTRLHPGDDVELRVYANGRFRTMDLRVARASELSRRHAIMMTGGGLGLLGPEVPAPAFGLNGVQIGGQVREAIERAMDGANRALEGVGRGLQRTRIYLPDDMPDEAPRAEPIEPVHVEPLEPSQLCLRVPPPVPRVRTATIADAADEPSAVAAVAIGDNEPTAARRSGSSIDISGLRMVPVGDELASYLGAGSERGLLVVEVPHWARSALRAGDVVLTVDGREVRPTASEVTIALPRSRDVQLDILRERVHHTVTLPARR
jgi:S1-C subfamily serine protease